MTVLYATVEDVRSATESSTTADDTTAVLRALGHATTVVDEAGGLARESFRPVYATKYFRWPDQQTSSYYRLWLNNLRLISVSALSSAGTTISASDYFLEPNDTGPPYSRIEIDLDSSASFGYSTSTPQRAISVTGLWGWDNTQESAGTVTTGVNNSITTLVASDGTIGIGDHLTIEDEILIVTGRAFNDSTQTINAGLSALTSDSTVAVDDGTLFTGGETILIDSERMLVRDISGNNLSVKRAWDGTTLAAHANASPLSWSHTFTVTRGARGSAAAAHLATTAVTAHVVPGDVAALAVAVAVATLRGERSAYAGSSGAPGASAGAAGTARLDELKRLVDRRGIRTRVV